MFYSTDKIDRGPDCTSNNELGSPKPSIAATLVSVRPTPKPKQETEMYLVHSSHVLPEGMGLPYSPPQLPHVDCALYHDNITLSIHNLLNCLDR